MLHLRPLGKLVDGDVEVAVAPERARERSQNVQPPDRERPREGDGLQFLRGLVDLLGVELAGLAGPNERGGVLKCGGLVETAAEGFAGEGARRGVVTTVSTMDVGEDLASFFSRDTPQGNPVGALA